MTKTFAEEKQKQCLLVFKEKGKFAVHEHFKSLRPIYSDLGWFIEEKHREVVTRICQQADMHFGEWPFLENETFNDLKRRYNKAFFEKKRAQENLHVDALKAKLGISILGTEILTEEEQRKSLEALQDGRQLLAHIEEINRLQNQIDRIEQEEKIAKIPHEYNVLPIIPIKDRISSHNDMLSQYRGKKYLGLRVKTIEELNENLKGLRKLILLAAAPNVGKTALTIQLAQEVLSVEEDACLVYISLEMTSDEIFTRTNLCLSGLDFNTFVLGKEQIENEDGGQPLFSTDELRKIEESTKHLEQIGDRLQIIDLSTCPTLNSDIVINYIERLKTQTKCSRAIVIIDYLQVWPIPQGLRFSSDIEADKWRIGEIKKIRDAINKINQDPIIVISEARKPASNDDSWGNDLSDVMGSARGTYTPDAVLLLSAIQPAQLKKLWEKMKMPDITYKGEENEPDDPKDPSNIKGFLAHHGIAICNLKMPKARDGMKKFNILLAFHFYKNKFTPINWSEIKTVAANFGKEPKK